MLILFSDMREFTRHLNFEAPYDHAFAKVDEGRFLANLKRVDVFVLGADAAGQEVAQSNRIREFWATYFQKTGASLRKYSMIRPPPELQRP